MIKPFKTVFSLLGSRERRSGAIVFAIILTRGILETVGVVSVMPFIAVASNPALIQSNRLLRNAYELLGFTTTGSFLIALCGAAFAVLVVSTILGAIANAATYRYAQRCNLHLSCKLLAAYLARPYSWFLNQHTAELSKTVLHDVDYVVSLIVVPSINMMSKIVAVIFLLILVIAIDPVVAVTAAAMFGLIYAAIFWLTRRRLVALGKQIFSANEVRFKTAQEALSGFRDVKIAGLESAYVEKYREQALRFSRADLHYKVIADLPKFLLEAVAFGGMLGILLFLLISRPGGLAAALPVVAVYAFAGYKLLPAMQQIYQSLAMIKVGGESLSRVEREIREHAVDSASPTSAVTGSDLRPLSKEICLDHVTFTYPGAEKPALSDLQLTISANSMVAFVGSTGAGKTTVVDLLLGLLSPSAGALRVDGQAIGSEQVRAWQRDVGYVPQQVFLVDDTVAANIAFGISPEKIDTVAVERAAALAELHDFIVENMSDGYQTRIGERGIRLSGGQRQRIGIARALYHDPTVLVLDEATSALDNTTERAVMSSIRNLAQRKTVIIIAHRLSTVQDCDVVFMLEAGRVTASGTFDEVVASNERFREMARIPSV